MKQPLVLIPIILLLALPLVSAPDVPYSFGTTNNLCFEDSFLPSNDQGTAGGNPYGYNQGAIGVYSSDFTGRTLTNIAIYLCAGDFSGSPDFDSDTNDISIGVFDKTTGAAKSIFDTVPFASIPRMDFASQDDNPNLIAADGSYVMQSNDMIGFYFSSANLHHLVVNLCGDPCNGSQMENGGIKGAPSAGSPSTPADNPGYAQAGDLTFSDTPPPAPPKPSQTSSAFIPAVIVLTIGFFVLGFIASDKRTTTAQKEEELIGAFMLLAIIFIAFMMVGL